MDTSILELLRGVRGELSSAGAGSTVSLARPRARLAWIASLMPPECSEQRRLLDMAAQVAAEIGLGQVGGVGTCTACSPLSEPSAPWWTIFRIRALTGPHA